MSYIGDYPQEATIDTKFTTRSFSTGQPTTLAGTPSLRVYAANSTSEITAGITLTTDFDGIAGLNHVRIEATTPNGYPGGFNYQVVIAAGTVGGVSVVGEVVAEFSLLRSPALRSTVAGRTLDVSAAGHVETVDICTTNTDMRGTDNASTHAPTDIVTNGAIATTNGEVDKVGTVNVLNGHTPQSGDSFPAVSANLDAAVSSRSSHSAADVWAVATRTITGGTINTLAAGAISAASLAAAACNKIADHLWRRNYAAIRASSDGDAVIFRSPMGSVAKLTNKVDAQNDPLEVFHEDDTTLFGTQTLTTDPNADPITSVDTN